MKRTLTLPDWGPYSRHYMGISKLVPDGGQRQLIDFTFVPGYMRGRIVIPDVNFDSGYHPWLSTPDFSYYAVRYDLQWKDTEYCHAEYFPCEEGTLLKLRYVNNSPLDREYSATCFAVQRLHSQVYAEALPGECWIGGEQYATLDYRPPVDLLPAGENYETFCHLRYLSMGHDGLRRGVTIQENLVDTAGLGNRLSHARNSLLTIEGNRTFLMQPGTRITWEADGARHAYAYLRLSMAGIERIDLRLSSDDWTAELSLRGEAFADSETLPALVRVALPEDRPLGTLALETLSVTGREDRAFLLDGMLLTQEAELSAVEARFRLPALPPRFDIHRFSGQKGVALTTAQLPGLSIAMYSPDERPVPPPPYSDCSVTNLYHQDLSGSRILRKLNNDSLLNWGIHNCQLHGDGLNHFSGYHAAPIVCPAGTARDVYIALVCDGEGAPPAESIARAGRMYARRAEIEHAAREAKANWLAAQRARVWDNPYGFSQERLMCNILSNVTFPVYIKDGFYRTYTPGKRWGGLFTWDSGMLGIGLAEYAPEHAKEILHQYFADPDDPDIDAVLHGTQLPLHIYLLFHLYQRTGDRELLRTLYPSARKYYRYFAGVSEQSSYDKFHSGLLCPFEDGYNVEGIDDYPPQHYAGLVGAYDRISPACTSAHAIRTGKLLALMAAEIGEEADIAEIERWNAYLADALQRYAWDEGSGYFSYVWNESREPLFYDEGKTVNFNMGIDGASPLVAGILTEQQVDRVCGHLMTPGEMWTPYGITSVDLTAPYARRDGYWNGKVWIPHQWFFYKALITEGRPEEALRIARKALHVWETSVADTYNCYEQFCSVTGMGEGCHNFGGLSAPVAAFYHDLYEKGRVTAGFDSLVRDVRTEGASLSFTLFTPYKEGPTSIMACVGKPGRYRIDVDGDASYAETDAEVLPVALPCAKGDRRIEITPA